MTAHFFLRYDHRRHVVTLAVRLLPHPHTADNIKKIMDEVLMEWDILLSKVAVVITDNGSNMVKMFKKTVQCTGEDEGETEEDETEEGEEEEICEDDDFEEREIDHDLSFECYCKRLSCFAHTLQLVIQAFSKDATFKPLLKKVTTWWRRLISLQKPQKH